MTQLKSKENTTSNPSGADICCWNSRLQLDSHLHQAVHTLSLLPNLSLTGASYGI